MNEPKNKGGVSHKGSPTLSAKPAPKQPKQKKVSHAAPPSAKTPLKRTTPRVKKSPVKAVVNDEEDIDEVLYEKRCEHNDEERASCECQVFVCVDCPCGDWSVEDRKSIQCPTCCHWFHHDCIGLEGLLKEDVSKLRNWACYPCWSKTSPIAPSMTVLEVLPEGEEIPELDKREKGESTLDDIMEEMSVLKGQLNELKLISAGKGRGLSDCVAGVSPATRGSSGELNCQTVGLMMKEQLHLQVPVIAARVKDVIEAGVKKIIDSNVEQKKTYAEMSKGLEEKVAKSAKINKEMMEDVVKSGNVEQAKKTEANLNLEAYERLKRKQNVIVRGVPESNSEVIATRIEHDLKWIIVETDIAKDDIVRCYRPGQRKKNTPRPLICVLKTEEMVQQYTNFGRGCKIGDGNPKDSFFVNLDLSPADQEADFLARKANSERKKQEQK